jgi:hypothetical protein
MMKWYEVVADREGHWFLRFKEGPTIAGSMLIPDDGDQGVKIFEIHHSATSAAIKHAKKIAAEYKAGQC